MRTHYLFGPFLQSEVVKNTFLGQYQSHKEKRLKLLRENFFTRWWDLQWWKKKLVKDQEGFQTQKDKDSWFSKLWNAYKIFTKFGRIYKTIKSMVQAAKNSEGFKALFGRSYNLYNQKDYRDFETNLGNALTDSVDVVKAGVMTWLKPTIYELRYTFLRELQRLYDDFAWWVLVQLIWGHNWFDNLLSLGGYVASIWIGPSGIAANAAIRGGKLLTSFAKICAKIARIGVKAGLKAGARSAGRSSVRVAGTSMRVWGRKVLRGIEKGSSSGAAAIQFSNTLSKLKKHKILKTVANSTINFYITWYALTDYQRIYHGITSRTKMMYRGLEGELTKLQYGGQMIGDVFGYIKSAKEKSTEQFLQRMYGENRVNTRYGLKMKMSKEKYKSVTFFVAIDKITNNLNKIEEEIKSKINFNDIFKWNRWGRIGTDILNLEDDSIPSIGFHRRGKQLLLQRLNGNNGHYKMSIVIDQSGKVKVVQIDDLVIDWQKQITTDKGLRNKIKVSGFEWIYNPKSGFRGVINSEQWKKWEKKRKSQDVRQQYLRKSKISLGAKITLNGVNFIDKNKKPINKTISIKGTEGQYKDKQVVSVTIKGINQNESSISIIPNELLILGKDIDDSLKIIRQFGDKQKKAQTQFKKQCQLMLQIIKDKISNDEGKNYDKERAEELIDEIMTTLENMQYYDVIQYYDTDGQAISETELGKSSRTKTSQKIGAEDIKNIRKDLKDMANRGDVSGLERVRDKINGKVKRDERNVAYTQHTTKIVLQQVTTYQDGDLSVKWKEVEDGEYQYQEKLFAGQIDNIIDESMSTNYDYIDDKGNYHSE